MKAVILAAGKSTRTYPLTVNTPKPLLKILNKEIIFHNLDSLSGLVDEAILVVGFNKEKIMETVGKRYRNIKIRYIEQKKQDGSGGALLVCKEHLTNKFLVLNGDDIFSHEDIKNCIKKDNCVLIKEVSDLSRFGQVIVDRNHVKEIIEKPGKIRGYANTGLYVLSPEIFKHTIAKSKRGEYELTDYITYLAKKDMISYELLKGEWLPISYPWNLLDATEKLILNIKKDVKGLVEKGATIKGEIIVGRGTIIKAGSYIEGPVIIGNDCIIGPNCFIRAGTVVGNNCKIGNGVEVKNSIIGNNTSISHLSYVGDSIIGKNVNFGAGTKVANLRHDKMNVKSIVKGELVDTYRKKFGTVISDNVSLGINTLIYPGRKIWPGKTTLPGEIIKEDVI